MSQVCEVLSCGRKILIPVQLGSYVYKKTISKGTFSVVTEVLNLSNKQIYACKVLDRDLLQEYGMLEQIEQELRIMETINHPNLVKTRGIMYTDKIIGIVMDLYVNGDLFYRIEDHGALPHHETQKIFNQIVSGISYLHSKNIVHLDIKPENIFLDANYNAYLGDYSLSRYLSHEDQKIHCKCGTLYYIAPEIVAEEAYDGKKSDIWSLGILLYTMATGMIPWSCGSDDSIEDQILDAVVVIPSSVSPVVESTLWKLLKYNPEERPSANMLLQLPWVNKTGTCIKISRHIAYIDNPGRIKTGSMLVR